MGKPILFTSRELLLASLVVALSISLLVALSSKRLRNAKATTLAASTDAQYGSDVSQASSARGGDKDPVFLHVYGSMVESTHDDLRPADSPASPHGPPWTRIATAEIYDGLPFGFFTPNNRAPAIGIDGRLDRDADESYRGELNFWLDDSNLTYVLDDPVVLRLGEVVTIDRHFDIYLLTPEEDPYRALSDAMRTASASLEEGDRGSSEGG